MAVSLKQIAAQTNVSIATVSKVLSGRDDISEKTRQRVLKVAHEMNYRPNLLVRGIQTGKTNSIGVMVPVGADSFFSMIVNGIHSQLQDKGCVPILLWASKRTDGVWEHGTELQAIHQLVDRRVDGLIIRPVEDDASDDYLHEIHDHHLPLVAVDRMLPNSHKADFVGTDDIYGGQLAAKHLLELGHRHILHLAGPSFASTARDRREGFENQIHSCSDVTYEVLADESFTGSQKNITQYLKQNHKATAIFAANDLIASKVYSAMTELGLQVGKDISVLGFSDMTFAQYLQPALTTIRQNPLEIGHKAANLIVNRCKTSKEFEDYSPVQIRLKPELIIRKSTAQKV